jgi:hypothetical protein
MAFFYFNRSKYDHKKRFMVTLKSLLRNFDINLDTWKTTASDRTDWRSALHKGAAICEESRRLSAVQLRQLGKSRNLRRIAKANIPWRHSLELSEYA